MPFYCGEQGGGGLGVLRKALGKALALLSFPCENLIFLVLGGRASFLWRGGGRMGIHLLGVYTLSFFFISTGDEGLFYYFCSIVGNSGERK
jgi:hypothetical protein